MEDNQADNEAIDALQEEEVLQEEFNEQQLAEYEPDQQIIEESVEDIENEQVKRQIKPKRKRVVKHQSQQSENIFDDNQKLDRLPLQRHKLLALNSEVRQKIRELQFYFLDEQKRKENVRSFVGQLSVPICADVTKFDFSKLMEKQLELAGRGFDVVMMDPPWRLSSSQPSRGVAIQYNSLSDQSIQALPVQKLQQQGFLFVWVINAKFQFTVQTMQHKWGYTVVDSINWVKKTVNGRIAKGHGFYLQHAKETCLVGIKGNPALVPCVASDVIFSNRRGQSQKPTEIYEYIEQLVPNGYYLQIFGRRNNLRNRWVTVGNQL